MKTARGTLIEGQQLKLNLAGDPATPTERPVPASPARARWWLQHIRRLITQAAAAGAPARPRQVELNLPTTAGKAWTAGGRRRAPAPVWLS